jgi:hypothetical protein
MEVRDVDRLDRRVDVRVGGQQHATSQRIGVAGLREHVGPLQARHPLIADHHGQCVPAGFQLLDRRQRLLAR